MNPALQRRILTWGLMIVIIAALLIIGWQVIFARPFVRIVLPDGATKVELSHIENGRALTTSVNQTGTIRLRTGSYNVMYYKDKQVIGLKQAEVKASLNQSISETLQSPTNKLATVMHDRAKLLTPLGEGYIFQDSLTNGLSYATREGIQDISAEFLLSTTPPDPDAPDGDYNTVVNIQQTKDGVVVTTTWGVFVAKSASDVTRLPSSTDEFLFFTSSGYDPQTNRLFVLPSYQKDLFYYDLNNLEQGPRTLYTAAQDINRIAVGGGRVAVYFDDVPSVEPEVLATYALTRQLAPTVIDAASGKTEKTLKGYDGVTLAAISDDGKYIALKRKFATTMEVIELAGSRTFTVPAPDANGLVWKGSVLFFGRDQSLWSVEPAKNGEKVRYVAPAGQTLNRLVVDGDSLLATTTTNFAVKMVSNDVDVDNLLAEKLKIQPLKTSDYFIAYTDFGGQLTATVMTSGTFERGMDESQLIASQGPAYQKAVEAIKSVPGSDSIIIKQKSSAIIFQYQYTGIPTDEQS